MNRLFTFGCSFTSYLWPTWADILSLDNPSYFNWGHPGLGNRAIAERLSEAHARFKISKDDLVIIQWTSHLRHDWMNNKFPKTDHSAWRTKGSIFTKENQKIFDHKWMQQFWDERSYYIHTLNHINLAQGLLKSTGCNWYMTSMSDLGMISTEVSPATVDGEIPSTDANTYDVWRNSPDLIDYKETIWDQHQDHWVEPIMATCDSTKDQHWWFKSDPKNEKGYNTYKGQWMEPHPSVNQHALWLLKLKEKMNQESKLSLDQSKFVEEFNTFKSSTETYKEFEEKVNLTFWANTRHYRGF
jgi:hypothetical protein